MSALSVWQITTWGTDCGGKNPFKKKQKRNNPHILFTCLKQKGIVSTLTPTMLFTTFIIKPQLDDVILALISECFKRSSEQWSRGSYCGVIPTGRCSWVTDVSGTSQWRGALWCTNTAQHTGKREKPWKYFNSDTHARYIHSIWRRTPQPSETSSISYITSQTNSSKR